MLGLQVRVLGQPTLVVGTAAQALAGGRLLLVVRLALARGSDLSIARLARDLSADGEGSEGAVRVAMTRVRQALGDDAIVRTSHGYRLGDHSLDAARFERAVALGRDVDRATTDRIEPLDRALAMWSGPALDGLPSLPWVDQERRRLDELREQAVDERFALEVGIGRHGHAIPELRAAVERDPTRESRAELLALALYRSGRQADALATIDATRRVLRDRLGLDPGPSMRRLEQQMLTQAPELAITGFEVAKNPVVAPAREIVAEIEARVRASTTMLRSGAFGEAATIISDAERMADTTGDRRAHALVLHARARLAGLTGDDPRPAIEQARCIARELGDGRLLAQGAVISFSAGVPTDRMGALVELTEPIELLEPSAPERIHLLCAAAMIVIFTDASDAADRLLVEAEEVHDAIKSPRSKALVQVTRSLVGAVNGAPITEVTALAEEGFALARTLEDPELVTVSLHAVLRARYAVGDLRGVDELLVPLDRASRSAMLNFGIIRAAICRTTNALARGELDEVPALIEIGRTLGERLVAHSAEPATRSHELLLLLETGRVDFIVPVARLFHDPSAPTIWAVILAMCGDEDEATALSTTIERIPRDDTFDCAVAMAAEVALRRRDRGLGEWCRDHLDGLEDRTAMVGFGTLVMGFAAHYAAMASAAVGDLDASRRRFERAVSLADGAGAGLWAEHSRIELADVLVRSGDPATARDLADRTANSTVAAASPRLTRRVTEVRDACAASAEANDWARPA